MRVTDTMRMLEISRANAQAASRLADATRHAGAGARVVAPSDDPVAYAVAVRRTASLETLRTRTTLSRAAADELSIAERALDGASELMSEAKSLALQGANEALGPADRKLLAERVRAIRESVVELANTRGTRGFVFGGTRTDIPPFDPTGAFAGNDGQILVPVSDGIAPRANASGAKAFTSAGGRDVLADLEALAAALETDDLASVRASIDAVDAGHAQVVRAQVDVGFAMDRFRVVGDLHEEAAAVLEVTLTKGRGADDLASLFSELNAASSTYQQSLEVTRKLLALPSLAE
jgi:flagellar hook-associated protein 3 FlgL